MIRSHDRSATKRNVIRQFPLTETAQLPFTFERLQMQPRENSCHSEPLPRSVELGPDEAGPHAEPEYPICFPFQKTCATIYA